MTSTSQESLDVLIETIKRDDGPEYALRLVVEIERLRARVDELEIRRDETEMRDDDYRDFRAGQL